MRQLGTALLAHAIHLWRGQGGAAWALADVAPLSSLQRGVARQASSAWGQPRPIQITWGLLVGSWAVSSLLPHHKS